MLNNLKAVFPDTTCIGIEYSNDLIACRKNKTICLLQGDALVLPVKENVFDVVIATAIIEHVSGPMQLIREAFRVLRKKWSIYRDYPSSILGRDCYENWSFKRRGAP